MIAATVGPRQASREVATGGAFCAALGERTAKLVQLFGALVKSEAEKAEQA